MIRAVAEKVKVNATNARPMRSFETGRQTMARPTSQVTYQAKNQGVTMSNAPSVASAASIMVRVVGMRQIHIVAMMSRQPRVT